MYEKQQVQSLANSAHLINGDDDTCNDKPWHLKMEFRLSPRCGKNLDTSCLHTSEPWCGQRRETFPKGQNHVHLAKANIEPIPT